MYPVAHACSGSGIRSLLDTEASAHRAFSWEVACVGKMSPQRCGSGDGPSCCCFCYYRGWVLNVLLRLLLRLKSKERAEYVAGQKDCFLARICEVSTRTHTTLRCDAPLLATSPVCLIHKLCAALGERDDPQGVAKSEAAEPWPADDGLGLIAQILP